MKLRENRIDARKIRFAMASYFLFFCFIFFAPPVVGFEFTALEYTGEPFIESAEKVITSSTRRSSPGDHVRVAFYNIEMFTDGISDGKNRTEELAMIQAAGAARIVEQIKPDILFISEIENDRALGYLNNSFSNSYPLGYLSVFGSGSSRAEKMNIAMLTRYQPVSATKLDFSTLVGAGRPTRGVFRAIFDLGDSHYLLVYAVHLKANFGDKNRNYSQRVNAMNIIQRDKLDITQKYPNRNWEMIVLGDFNTDPTLDNLRDDPTLSVLGHWSDIWLEHPSTSQYHTVATRYGDPRREFPPSLFDRILVHQSLREKPWDVSLPGTVMEGTETHDVSVLPGQGGHISDHYPIYIDLRR
ncbi:MAG TPA: endonuclease/exonuclease/phosphatase family protein [Kiritimatiellia bacterium]|nr:endonuclease/exonuclease/phosphatase family protein [Kiritimatiellia bacterium]